MKRTETVDMRLPKAGSLLGSLLLAAALVSCAPAAARAERSITVAAASDLGPAFTEIGRLFEQQTGSRVVFIFGSSGTLAKQIENGAPVDLFASADEGYVNALASRGLVLPETLQLYALGRIALVSHKQSGLSITRLQDLLRPEVRHVALANPDHAPYGRAGRKALQAAGLWDEMQPRVVYGENVGQALQFVQTGNAEAGIVAVSIANAPEVNATAVDESLYEPLRQSMAVVRGSRQEPTARDLEAFVNSEQGRSIMKLYGFASPDEAR